MSDADAMNNPAPGRFVARRPADGTDGVFTFEDNAVIGRFDPSVGPIAVDLGTLPDGGYVSRRHAELQWRECGWWLKDLGSSNGTFVRRDAGEFERVDEMELRNGDEVAFGNAHLRVEIEGEEAAVEPAEEEAAEEATELDGAATEPEEPAQDPV